MDSQLLDTRELAELLKCSPRTISNRRSAGLDFIPHIRVGRLVRYRRDDAEAFIENGGGDPDTEPSR